jgi:hypothetical protein
MVNNCSKRYSNWEIDDWMVERYGAKYENGVAYLLSYTVSVEKLWTQNTRIIHDVWRLLILSNEEKTNDYENFEKGMIYMKILKKRV